MSRKMVSIENKRGKIRVLRKRLHKTLILPNGTMKKLVKMSKKSIINLAVLFN